MQIVPTKPMTQSLDAALDRPNRQAVRRSPAFELLAVNVEAEATIAEVKQLMDPPACQRVRSALRSTNIELTEPGDAEMAVLSALIAKFLRITGSSMAPGARDEYTAGVLDELAGLPYLLVRPALEDARLKVEFPGKLLVWIFAQIENKLAGLNKERSTYERLLAIADTDG